MNGKMVAAVAAVMVLAGCGATKYVTQTTTATVTHQIPPAQANTVTVVRTRKVSSIPPVTKTVTQSVTVGTVAPTPTPTPTSSSSFSGNGEKSLGTINVPTASTLDWTCSGCSAFEVSNNLNDSGTIGIASNAASGGSAIDAGTYHDVQVISDGNWTLKIVPG